METLAHISCPDLQGHEYQSPKAANKEYNVESGAYFMSGHNHYSIKKNGVNLHIEANNCRLTPNLGEDIRNGSFFQRLLHRLQEHD